MPTMRFGNLKLGAGGDINAIDVANDGTLLCRCDVFGAYYYDRSAPNPGNTGGLGKWKQLVTVDSMSSEPGLLDWIIYLANGVHEIRVAPNASNIFYMVLRGRVFVTTDRGSKWKQTNFPYTDGISDANSATSNFRNYRYKMAVDPINPSVVYFGPYSTSPYRTLNGLDRGDWTVIAGITTPDGNQTYCAAIDASSSPINGRKSMVYISSTGTGLYKSIDGGDSFSLVPGTPTQIVDLWVASDGTVYCVNSTAGTLHRLIGSTWADITPSGVTVNAITVHPTNPANVVVWPFGAVPRESVNATTTASWAAGPAQPSIKVSTDTPMIGSLFEQFYMNVISPVIDPSDTTKAYVSTLQGVWRTSLPIPVSPAQATFTTMSAGIEEVVGEMSIKPPGGKGVFLAGQDVGINYQPDINSYAPAQRWYSGAFLEHCSWIDYASGDTTFLVGTCDRQGVEKSGYSLDGGVTWQAFATFPTTTNAVGCIAAATSQEIVWVQSAAGANDGLPWRTGNRGGAWANIPGLPAHGYHHAYFNNRCIVAADRVNIGTFYIQCSDDVTPANMGTYVVSNNGSTVVFHANKIDSISSDSTTVGTPHGGASNGLLLAVPGNAGHLLFSTGTQGSGGSIAHPASEWPHTNKFWFSHDAGATWDDVGTLCANNWTFREIIAFGVGAPAPGQSYPAMYVYGWVVPGSAPAAGGSKPGLWASFDAGVTWTQLAGMHPNGVPDWIRHISGDPDIYGRIYLAYQGTGFAFGQLVAGGPLRFRQR